LALKKPPPLVPHSLIASCDATGPCAITCSVTVDVVALPAASVVVVVCGSTSWTRSYGLRFCTTPCDTSSSAPTMQNGSSTQSAARVMSTQKLPRESLSRLAIPRMKAIASAMPVAADTKLWYASPAICEK
jgi:hypothetical protein